MLVVGWQSNEVLFNGTGDLKCDPEGEPDVLIVTADDWQMKFLVQLSFSYDLTIPCLDLCVISRGKSIRLQCGHVAWRAWVIGSRGERLGLVASWCSRSGFSRKWRLSRGRNWCLLPRQIWQLLQDMSLPVDVCLSCHHPHSAAVGVARALVRRLSSFLSVRGGGRRSNPSRKESDTASTFLRLLVFRPDTVASVCTRICLYCMRTIEAQR